MDCCNEEGKRMRSRTEEEKKLFTSRINRIIGQLNGVKKMIDEDRYCDDVLIQLSAIEKAVKSVASVVLEKHMHSCLVEEVQKGNLGIIDEITELFKRF